LGDRWTSRDCAAPTEVEIELTQALYLLRMQEFFEKKATMTSTEALSILQQADGHGHIGWNAENNIPDVHTGTIVLDGEFSEQELRALLVFFTASDEPVE